MQMMNLRYLATQVLERGLDEVELDLTHAVIWRSRRLGRRVRQGQEKIKVDLAQADSLSFTPLQSLRCNFVNMQHLLGLCETLKDMSSTLYSRLQHLPELASTTEKFENDLPRPCIVAWRPLPDLPHPALIRTLAGHKGDGMGHGVFTCAFSPDGAFIVSKDVTVVKLWDARTGVERMTFEDSRDESLSILSHPHICSDCVVSPKNNFIACKTRKSIKGWNLPTMDTRFIITGYDLYNSRCSVSPDGKWIASFSGETLYIWDTSTGRELFRHKVTETSVYDCVFGPKNDWILIASDEEPLKIWDVHTQEEICAFGGYSLFRHCKCVISPKGDFVISPFHERTLVKWDIETGEKLLEFEAPEFIHSCALSPLGDYLVTGLGGLGTSLIIWDVATGEEILTLDGHTNTVRDCAVSSDGKIIASASDDGTIKLWNAYFNSPYQRVRPDYYDSEPWRSNNDDEIDQCVLNPNGDLVFIVEHRCIKIIDTGTSKTKRLGSGSPYKVFYDYVKEHTLSGWVEGCAFSPTGEFFILHSDARSLRVFDTHTGRLRSHLLITSDTTRWIMAISTDGKWIAAPTKHSELGIWDSTTGDLFYTLAHGGSLNGCVFIPQTELIATVGKFDSKEAVLKVWNMVDGSERFSYEIGCFKVRDFAMSPCGEWGVCATSEGKLHIINLDGSGERLSWKAHQYGITGTSIMIKVDVSPDGKWIVSASSDKTLKVWDSSTGERLSTFYADGKLNDCAIFPDGERIVAVGEHGMYWLKFIQ